MAEDFDAVWLATLDAMEAELNYKVDDEDAGSWTAPTSAGPLPEHLVARAQKLLGAQQMLIARLTDEQATVRQHLAALQIVPSAQPTGQSVYLDVTG